MVGKLAACGREAGKIVARCREAGELAGRCREPRVEAGPGSLRPGSKRFFQAEGELVACCRRAFSMLPGGWESLHTRQGGGKDCGEAGPGPWRGSLLRAVGRRRGLRPRSRRFLRGTRQDAGKIMEGAGMRGGLWRAAGRWGRLRQGSRRFFRAEGELAACCSRAFSMLPRGGKACALGREAGKLVARCRDSGRRALAGEFAPRCRDAVELAAGKQNFFFRGTRQGGRKDAAFCREAGA